jgi:hypothetical protein
MTAKVMAQTGTIKSAATLAVQLISAKVEVLVLAAMEKAAVMFLAKLAATRAKTVLVIVIPLAERTC